MREFSEVAVTRACPHTWQQRGKEQAAKAEDSGPWVGPRGELKCPKGMGGVGWGPFEAAWTLAPWRHEERQ